MVQEEPVSESKSFASRMTLTERFFSILRPFQSNDFRIVFFTRFLMQMGILTVQEYLQFYLKDAIGPDFIISGTKVSKK